MGHDKHNEIIAAVRFTLTRRWERRQVDKHCQYSYVIKTVTYSTQMRHKSQGQVSNFYQMTVEIILLEAGRGGNLCHMVHS